VAIVFLNQTHDPPPSPDDAKVFCPASVNAAVENEDVASHGTAIGNAIEIRTSVPATVYDIYPYGGAASYFPSATLLLPTNVWDTNYVAVTMAETPASFPPGVDFVARQDGTTVSVLPSTDIIGGGGVASATKGNPVTYNLDKGQTIHLMQQVDGAGHDLSGSVVQSNNPIGVWGEHFCLSSSATKAPNWRMLGVVDGTTLTYDPPNPSAPQTIGRGQLVEFDGPSTFHVQSQDAAHPFYLAAHRPDDGDCDSGHQQIPPITSLGSEYVAVGNDNSGWWMGGPETVNVVPPAQFLKSYLFFTDPSYANTDLALVRVKDGVFKDVTLDCVGVVSGWKPVGSSGQYEYAHIVNTCPAGTHTIKSDAPVGITVWGYDSAASYAYAAGASVKPINTVVVIVPN
jgi:hypothetical protein